MGKQWKYHNKDPLIIDLLGTIYGASSQGVLVVKNPGLAVPNRGVIPPL
jgi:hypothetical protein